MTRKHYHLLAIAIAEAQLTSSQAQRLLPSLLIILKQDNASFSPERFLAAIGAVEVADGIRVAQQRSSC